MKTCKKCGTELHPLQSFKWNYSFFKCYKKYDNFWLCDGCYRKLSEVSCGRFFMDLLGEENDGDFYEQRVIHLMKVSNN